jgi:hypothetical protein
MDEGHGCGRGDVTAVRSMVWSWIRIIQANLPTEIGNIPQAMRQMQCGTGHGGSWTWMKEKHAELGVAHELHSFLLIKNTVRERKKE